MVSLGYIKKALYDYLDYVISIVIAAVVESILNTNYVLTVMGPVGRPPSSLQNSPGSSP